MSSWIAGLSANESTLLGSAIGTASGLVAILLGALFNAHLNRKRDENLRSMEREMVISALRAELMGLSSTLRNNAEMLSEPKGGFLTPDLSHSIRVMPTLIPKLGLLDSKVVQELIGVYIIVEQYCENLLMMGGQLQQGMPAHRRLIYMPKERAEDVAVMNNNINAKIEAVIAKLSK